MTPSTYVDSTYIHHENAASAICGIAWACWAISPRRAYGLIYWPLLELALFSLLAHSHGLVLGSGSPHCCCRRRRGAPPPGGTTITYGTSPMLSTRSLQANAVQYSILYVAHHSGQVRMDFTAAGLKAHDEVKRRRGCPPADATHDGLYVSRQQNPKKQHIYWNVEVKKQFTLVKYSYIERK